MFACLITLDCARTDHVLGREALTPDLDRFRNDAVAFTRAHSHANTTLPSHVTMMTGELMPEHGVENNLCLPNSKHLFLSERLRQGGVRSGGFVGIQFLEKLYASQIDGLDRYFDLPDAKVPRLLLRRTGIKGARRGAGRTAGKALQWIKRHRDENAFCWMHLFDTHMAYQARGKWRRQYGVPEAHSARRLADQLETEGLVPYHPLGRERRPLEYYPRLYKASVSHTDEVLGRFFRALRSLGLYDEALIIVTADHGENLTENGVYCGHSLLFDETIRVPLLVKFPGRQHAGEAVAEPVGHRDLMPTILRHFDLACNRKPCRDLGTYLGPGETEPDRPLLAFHNKMFQGSVRKGPWTWIENLDLSKVPGPRKGLYRNVGLFDAEGRRAEAPSIATRLSRILHGALEKSRASRELEDVEEDSIKAHLRELGYL